MFTYTTAIFFSEILIIRLIIIILIIKIIFMIFIYKANMLVIIEGYIYIGTY